MTARDFLLMVQHWIRAWITLVMTINFKNKNLETKSRLYCSKAYEEKLPKPLSL